MHLHGVDVVLMCGCCAVAALCILFQSVTFDTTHLYCTAVAFPLQIIGVPNDLRPGDIPLSPRLGVASLPGDFPVPGVKVIISPIYCMHGCILLDIPRIIGFIALWCNQALLDISPLLHSLLTRGV